MQRTNIIQTAKQETTTRVSLQQVLDSQLLELGDDDLLHRIENELNDNSALEEGSEEHEEDVLDYEEDETPDDQFSLDDVSYNIDSEELPVYTSNAGEVKPEIPLGESKSFIDELNEQLAEHELEDDKQRELVLYLIASLNDNGFIDRPLQSLSDDLLFQHNVDASSDDILKALKVLQQFDPPGIGARDLQECMSIQLQRKIDVATEKGDKERLQKLNLAIQVVDSFLPLFKRNDQEQLARKLNVDISVVKDVVTELSKLNPRPGLSLSETSNDAAQTIVPDFIIETTVDGDISFTLRGGKIPQLRVNQAYQDMLQNVDERKLTNSQKDDLKYVRDNVERAEGFIQAIKKRQVTLVKTMQAIIDAQRPFILSQDDADLKPLTGGEIAKRIGMDGSTVSRAISNRYALLDGTLYPLKHFFMRTKRNADGEEVMRTQVTSAIKDIIDNEDKTHPLSDGNIAEALAQRGINIQRRTVANYREQLHIPIAALRRHF